MQFEDKYVLPANGRNVVYVSSEDLCLIDMYAEWLTNQPGRYYNVTITEAVHRLLRATLYIWAKRLNEEAAQSTPNQIIADALTKKYFQRAAPATETENNTEIGTE